MFRVAVNGGGCSGFQYSFKLEPRPAQPSPKDLVIEENGAALVVDKLSLEYLHRCSLSVR